MAGMHIEFCDGKSWVRLLDKKDSLNSSAGLWCFATLKKVQKLSVCFCLFIYLVNRGEGVGQYGILLINIGINEPCTAILINVVGAYAARPKVSMDS